jgi:hypothetical protein
LIHNFERRLNLLALFLSSFAFQIIRDSGKLRDGRSKSVRFLAVACSWRRLAGALFEFEHDKLSGF